MCIYLSCITSAQIVQATVSVLAAEPAIVLPNAGRLHGAPGGPRRAVSRATRSRSARPRGPSFRRRAARSPSHTCTPRPPRPSRRRAARPVSTCAAVAWRRPRCSRTACSPRTARATRATRRPTDRRSSSAPASTRVSMATRACHPPPTFCCRRSRHRHSRPAPAPSRTCCSPTGRAARSRSRSSGHRASRRTEALGGRPTGTLSRTRSPTPRTRTSAAGSGGRATTIRSLLPPPSETLLCTWMRTRALQCDTPARARPDFGSACARRGSLLRTPLRSTAPLIMRPLAVSTFISLLPAACSYPTSLLSRVMSSRMLSHSCDAFLISTCRNRWIALLNQCIRSIVFCCFLQLYCKYRKFPIVKYCIINKLEKPVKESLYEYSIVCRDVNRLKQ